MRFPNFLSLIFLVIASSSVFSETVKEGQTLNFNGTEYFHRWSKATQHEFTPKDESDLGKWTDMITINVHESVNNGDELAEIANKVLTNYQSAGKIMRTDSKPRTATQPAEHFVVAALGDPAFLEMAFARFLLHDGVGVVVVYSHRIYGKAGQEMGKWLEKNGDKIEKALMSWDQLPPLSQLKKLSQSK